MEFSNSLFNYGERSDYQFDDLKNINAFQLELQSHHNLVKFNNLHIIHISLSNHDQD